MFVILIDFIPVNLILLSCLKCLHISVSLEGFRIPGPNAGPNLSFHLVSFFFHYYSAVRLHSSWTSTPYDLPRTKLTLPSVLHYIYYHHHHRHQQKYLECYASLSMYEKNVRRRVSFVNNNKWIQEHCLIFCNYIVP